MIHFHKSSLTPLGGNTKEQSIAYGRGLSSLYSSLIDLTWHKSAVCSGVSHTFAWLLVSHPLYCASADACETILACIGEENK